MYVGKIQQQNIQLLLTCCKRVSGVISHQQHYDQLFRKFKIKQLIFTKRIETKHIDIGSQIQHREYLPSEASVLTLFLNTVKFCNF